MFLFKYKKNKKINLLSLLTNLFQGQIYFGSVSYNQ